MAVVAGLLHAMKHLHDEGAAPLEHAPLPSPLSLHFALSLALV